MGQCPTTSMVTQKYAQWQMNISSSVEEGLAILCSGLPVRSLSFYLRFEKNGTPYALTTYPAGFVVTPPAKQNTGWDTRPNDSADSLCILFSVEVANDQFACLMFEQERKSPLLAEHQTLLEMSCPALAYRAVSMQQQSLSASDILPEALDAIDDGLIVYSEDEKVLAYNQPHKKLFPSFADALSIGASYEDLLRVQWANSELDIESRGGENWITAKKNQLKIDRYSTEQVFVDGHTIRLTHYRTPSGNTVAVRTDITELVESRQKAEENEAWIRYLLEGSPTPLLISVDGVYRYASSSAHELFEIPDGSLAGMHTSDFYHDLKDRDKLLAQLDVDGVVSRMKMDIRTFKGNRKTVLSSNTRINYRGEDAIFASVLDITDAEATALALRRSERQNRDLLELVPDALVVQVNGKIVYVNDSAVRIFKSDNKPNMIGTPSIDIIHKDERARIMDLRQAVMNGRNPTVILTRHSRFDGSTFHSEMYSKAVTWDGDAGTMNIIKDMSKRRSYEATLIQKEREMSLAQEIGHLGHWRIKLDDLTVVWSDELYRIHGLDPLKDQIDMDQAVKFVDPRDRQMMIDTVYKTADTQETQLFTIRINLSDGSSKTMMGSMRAEYDEDGAVTSVFGVSQDITDRLTLEDKLRQSQKMEAIGQLTGGVAHDFNNLLAVIQGNAELLLDLAQTLSKAERDQLKAIMRASHRGAMLTKSMLAFSRKQELRPTPTHLDKQVESITNMLARTLGKTIDIQISSEPDLWPCIADSSQVENAILNLALNARDAMPGGGILTISCQNTYLDETAAAPTENLKAGNYVMLSVQDNGSGIAPDDILHVFEPFYTTKEVGKGTGLGLSMVYGFVKQSEGHITIQSRPSEGTTVRIYLPQSETQPPLSQKDQDETPIINRHILLVEDDPAMRELSASLLTAMGATFQEAATGQEALKILKEKDGKFDLLLTDVMLPGGMSGPNISRKARRLYPKLKTLFMSGYTEDALTNDEGEKVPLLQKPFKRAELASKIASTLIKSETTN